MSTLEGRLAPFRARIKNLVQETNAPGLSVAVRRGDELWTAAAGLANIDTGQIALPQTKFLIGSITKVMTATLVMQLVDEGRVDLDTPARRYLPDLAVKDADVDLITVKSLLNHTNGIEGDYFADFGRGDDAIRRYVASLKDVPLIHETGRMFSYCNAGWVVLGLILEQLREKPYHEIIRDKLFRPLGLTEEALFPEESILGFSAVGHVARPEGGLRVTPDYLLSHALAPAGSVVNMTARALTQFGQLHIDGGKAPDGTRILSEASTSLMQQLTVKLPAIANNLGCGLGWGTRQMGKHRVVTHSGGTTGQATSLLVLPDQGLSLCSFTNGPGGTRASDLVLKEIGAELIGLEPAPKPVPADPPPKLDLARYTGKYASMSGTMEVRLSDGKLTARQTPPDGEVAGDAPAMPMEPIDETFFVVSYPPPEEPMVVAFIEQDADGRPEFVHMSRAMRRVTD